jgi:Domain of unknown function (DUF4965)/Domain of unknown function (DUF1793)/Domain of unknown function (DUF5127)/Domain of unknown function (DUF4964)
LRYVQVWLTCCALLVSTGQAQSNLRAPAVPLVTCDPYFSIWSPADRLNEKDTTHWTGRAHRLMSTITIDGKSFRLIGAQPAELPVFTQTSVSVLPTRTIYEFAAHGVALTLTFMTPALPESIDLLSWPVTYISYHARSTDEQIHQVAISFQASAEICVNEAQQPTTWSQPDIAGLSTTAVGSVSQNVLGRSGDDLRIDWGYLYIACPLEQMPMWKEQQLQLDMQAVDRSGKTRWLMVAYDDLYSIQYMKKNLRPYWRRNGWQASDLLQAASTRYQELVGKCKAFDDELMADLRAAGGEDYANLGALCFRQCFAAGKFVADKHGQPLQFSKENHSNGCIATSDVFYPMAPQFLLFGPSLAKSFVVPFMNYAASDRWKFPFAPHDLGQYPLANGQVYGGGEQSEDNQMPVEECGNLLLLITAIAQMEGNPHFANQYWKQIEQWAEYLKSKGFDPENQLCTDDFAGHLAHNVNLSAKAICAIGAYGRLCEMRGEADEAKKTFELARAFAMKWVKEADDGDHYRLAFDSPGSWSQKYNIVWDRILGLNIFPESVAKSELAFYRKQQGKYGIALDNRATYTKLDWILWTATLTQQPEDFAALLKPVIRFINETPDRSPLTDWYDTQTSKKVGFTARPVVGGVFLQLLYDKAVWNKWAGRDATQAENWAPLPKLPLITPVAKTASTETVLWKYTITNPGQSWNGPQFDASSWSSGKSGFGTRGTPGAVIGTEWSSSDIWIVRDVELPAGIDLAKLQLLVHHDEDVEVFINGQLAIKLSGYSTQYDLRALSAEARSVLKPGRNRLAVHCHQTGGGQYIDVGLVMVSEQE